QLKYSVGLFRKIGSIERKQTAGRPKKRIVVRQIRTSTSKTSICNLSQTVLKKDLQVFPAVHELLPPDFSQRRQYCNCFDIDNDDLLNKTFCSEEAWC
ncbi:hypothetical protein BDFB_013645, partial [Asbolus verrucosus]